jgi:hypothetical protein
MLAYQKLSKVIVLIHICSCNTITMQNTFAKVSPRTDASWCRSTFEKFDIELKYINVLLILLRNFAHEPTHRGVLPQEEDEAVGPYYAPQCIWFRCTLLHLLPVHLQAARTTFPCLQLGPGHLHPRLATPVRSEPRIGPASGAPGPRIAPWADAPGPAPAGARVGGAWAVLVVSQHVH